MEQVILVDKHDIETGVMEKLEAHREGALHRAISVFIFNSKGEMLLQQRAYGKYHSSGLWSNACCSHPRPGEATQHAAARRLQEEMGLQCELQEYFSFSYRTEFSNGLIEHEFDHVFVGITNEAPNPNPEEAAAWKYLSRKALLADVAAHAENYTTWFRLCLEDERLQWPQSA